MKKLLPLMLLLAAPISAQTYVVPGGFATKEGGSYHWMVGQYDYARAQQLYSKASMPATSNLLISSFSMRRDGLRTTAFEAHSVNMEVYMSNRAIDPPANSGYGWDDNHGPDRSLVMRKTTIKWGADPLPTTPPAPFSVKFILGRPFTYTGKAFVIEWTSDFLVTPPTKYNWNWVTDAELCPTTAVWSAYVAGSRVNIGTSCKPPGATSDPANYGVYPYPGGIFHKYMYLRTMQTGVPCLLFVGSSDKTWGTIPLPFDLALLGAPGCNLYVDMVQAHGAVTAAYNTTTTRTDWKLGVFPSDPALAGADYFIQMFAADPKFNALGVVSTYGRKYTFGTGFTGTCPGFCYYGYASSATSSFTLTQPNAVNYSARSNIIQLN